MNKSKERCKHYFPIGMCLHCDIEQGDKEAIHIATAVVPLCKYVKGND